MYALVTAGIMLALASALALQTGDSLGLMKQYRFNAQRAQLVMLAEHLELYFIEKGTYPASLAALSQTAGYEQVKSLLNVSQGYAVSGTLTDSVWQYKRMVVYSLDRAKGDTDTSYQAANSCGTGAFGAASSWCGSNTSVWFRKETREGMNDAVNDERTRLDRTLQKFADYFTANSAFPNKDGSGVALVAGNTYSLAALAGYAGTAAACSGVYTWRGLPIGCEDMFDAWGGYVGFVYTSDKAISLTSETPLVNAAGTPLIVASGFTM
jgi:hypothetical protein